MRVDRYKHSVIDDTVEVIITQVDNSEHRVLLDLADWLELKSRNITITYAVDSRGNKNYYAMLYENYAKVYLHRYLTKATENQVVDHKDHNTLNYKRDNLEVCTQSENMLNRKGAQSNSSTGIRGVYWIANRSKYGARVTIKGTHYNLGQYSLIEEATKAVTDFRAKYVPTSSEGRTN